MARLTEHIMEVAVAKEVHPFRVEDEVLGWRWCIIRRHFLMLFQTKNINYILKWEFNKKNFLF
jgi:hypothetical protein